MLQRLFRFARIEEKSCHKTACFQVGRAVLKNILQSQSQFGGDFDFFHPVQHQCHTGKGGNDFFLVTCVKISKFVCIEGRPEIIFSHKFIPDQRCDQVEKVILSGSEDHIFLFKFQAGGAFRIPLQCEINIQEMVRFIVAFTAVCVQRSQNLDRLFILSGSRQGKDQSFCDPPVEIGSGILFIHGRIDLYRLLIFSLQVVCRCQHKFCPCSPRILLRDGREQFFQILFRLRSFSLQEQQIGFPQVDGKSRFFFCDFFVAFQHLFRSGDIRCQDQSVDFTFISIQQGWGVLMECCLFPVGTVETGCIDIVFFPESVVPGDFTGVGAFFRDCLFCRNGRIRRAGITDHSSRQRSGKE